MVNNNEPPRNQLQVQPPQNQSQSQQHRNTTQQFNTSLLATVTESDSVKKQFNRLTVSNVTCKKKIVVSGLYPAEIRDSLICNNDNKEWNENIGVKRKDVYKRQAQLEASPG